MCLQMLVDFDNKGQFLTIELNRPSREIAFCEPCRLKKIMITISFNVKEATSVFHNTSDMSDVDSFK